ncbi:TlpA family protein disulfide reductase [Corynebacterium vitaeruminis]|uniref:TlpA family protein disulfide reductase n=1 Tax=Corynebacterium vitaeruminis TaxID=38305 RepID=UPI00068E0C89|nr:TlpA disulfide reductase family protein [Corynebacterium vitaeruminis]
MPSIRPAAKAGAAIVLAVAVSLGLAACGSSNTAGKDAVAVGGTFEFYSPDGKQEIFYDEADRKPISNLSGDSLMEEGKTISLDDYKDQVVVLNAWGQWCAPCRSESDDLEQVQEYLAQHNGTVLGINVRDFSQQISQDFVKDNGITYPSIYDPPFRTAASLGGIPASVVPTTIVLDKQHRPAAVFLREITAQDLLDVLGPLVDA